MKYLEKAKELYQQLFGHVDYRISQYVSEETVCSDIAAALKEAYELGLSEALKRVEELELILGAIKSKLFLTTLPCDHCDLQCETAPCTCTDYPLIDGRDECLKICETALAKRGEGE